MFTKERPFHGVSTLTFDLKIEIFWDPNAEVYVARCPFIKGGTSQGKTAEQAKKGLEEAIKLLAKHWPPRVPTSETFDDEKKLP